MIDLFKKRQKSGKINIKLLVESVSSGYGLCRVDKGGYKERTFTIYKEEGSLLALKHCGKNTNSV